MTDILDLAGEADIFKRKELGVNQVHHSYDDDEYYSLLETGFKKLKHPQT